MKIFCIDGVPGIGKSTAIQAVEFEGRSEGLKVKTIHFFTDFPKFGSLEDREISIGLEEILLKGDVTSNARISVFHELCSMACKAAEGPNAPWGYDLLIVERSPLTYMAYTKAILGNHDLEFADFNGAMDILNPVLLTGDPLDARARLIARDATKPKGFLHSLSEREFVKLHDAYLNFGEKYGLEAVSSRELSLSFALDQRSYAIEFNNPERKHRR